MTRCCRSWGLIFLTSMWSKLPVTLCTIVVRSLSNVSILSSAAHLSASSSSALVALVRENTLSTAAGMSTCVRRKLPPRLPDWLIELLRLKLQVMSTLSNPPPIGPVAIAPSCDPQARSLIFSSVLFANVDACGLLSPCAFSKIKSLQIWHR